MSYSLHSALLLLVLVSSFASLVVSSSNPSIVLSHSSIQKQSKKIMSTQNLHIKGGISFQSKDKKINASTLPTSATVAVKHSFGTIAWASWGVLQVILVFGNAIKRLWPIAIQPFSQNDFTPYHWAAYVAWAAFMMKTEGYDAFQKKLSPLVVKRAFGINTNKSFFKCLLAGPYSMGLFGATKKRMIVSWSVSVGVSILIAVVKRLPYPYRSIIDAGVVAGLSYGTCATLIFYVKALFGHEPAVDPCLPSTKQE